MALMLSPTDLGLAQPAGASLVRALMAKHGVSTPAPKTAPANPAAPSGPSALSVATGLSDKIGAETAALPTMSPDLPDAKPLDSLGGPDASTMSDTSHIGAMKGPGFLGRINDFLKSDEGRATMLRFAAGAFKGGLGGGLDGAIDFSDHRRKEAAEAAQNARENAFKTRELDDDREWRLGQLDNEASQNAETAAHNRATEDNASYATKSENWRADLHERGETGRTAMSQQGENYRKGMDVNEQRFEHVNASGDTVATQAGENLRHSTPQAVAPTPAGPGSIHAHYSGTPEEIAAQRQAFHNSLRPSEVRPRAAPRVGEVVSGYRFRGGDPNDRDSWEPAG